MLDEWGNAAYNRRKIAMEGVYMELWDAYDRDEKRTGGELVRGEPIPDGLYHLVCEVLVRHADGDYLLMKRARSKKGYPGLYEATAGGSALKGEAPIDCISSFRIVGTLRKPVQAFMLMIAKD